MPDADRALAQARPGLVPQLHHHCGFDIILGFSTRHRTVHFRSSSRTTPDAPTGALQWPRLLRSELALGQVIGGDMLVAGDPLTRARLRAQVVAVGPQSVAGRRFDVAVLEVFGDAQLGDSFTRVDGAMVVDRSSGVLLRLDLRSAAPAFSLQRRLVRVEPANSP